MIEVNNLTTKYPNGKQFQVSSAIFNNGQISTLIGRNGSGKSTLLKTLAGQQKYRGNILINNRECRDFNTMERAKEIAYLPQSLKSVNMDVKTLVEHGRFPYQGNFRRITDEDNYMVNRALKLTGMEDFAGRDINELSGGERQLAYLAMIIAQDSSMILMDEPTTFMDCIHQDEFFLVLKLLSDEGKGIVMVCHDIEQSFAYSDRIFLMENGNLEYSGTPDEMINNEEILRRNFGISMKKNTDDEVLYPYVVKR